MLIFFIATGVIRLTDSILQDFAIKSTLRSFRIYKNFLQK